MAGKTLGLVGLGKIGQAVARKLTGWDLNLVACDPFVDPLVAERLSVRLTDFESVCRQSDYLSLHVPLLPETRHLIEARSLAWMKPSAILINTARGPVIDLAALLSALNQGQIAQAGLDVFEDEPLPAESPLLGHPRIVVSDHTAWYSEEAQLQLQRGVAEETVRICLGGLPLSLANPEVLHRLGRWKEWLPPQSMQWQIRYLERTGVPAP
jgi:D-3-phosphoglycerate dehydrogenase